MDVFLGVKSLKLFPNFVLFNSFVNLELPSGVGARNRTSLAKLWPEDDKQADLTNKQIFCRIIEAISRVNRSCDKLTNDVTERQRSLVNHNYNS